MKYYRRSANEIVGAVNRCYFDADHGRVSLCLERLRELATEFPNDAHVRYAEGQILRDYFGEGIAARRSFAHAHELALHQGHATETAWFATCNMVQLACSEQEYATWAETAFCEKGKDQPECMHYKTVLEELRSGKALHEFLLGASQAAMESGRFGLAAALAEIVLKIWVDRSRTHEVEIRKMRSNCMRELDRAASQLREAIGEAFPPDERVTLHGALEELERAIELDPYDAALWNYRSAWCHLLGHHTESVQYADKAIELRPHRYPRPYINKAQALWALERDREARATAEEGLRQTEGCELPQDTIEQCRRLIAMYSVPRIQPTLEDLLPALTRVIGSAERTSQEELAQLRRAMVTFDTVMARVVGHLRAVQANPFKGYVPLVAELLTCFTPETGMRISLAAFEKCPPVPEYCITAAMYVAAHAERVHRRDAARYLCLMTVRLGDPERIRQYYRQAFLAVSAVAPHPMSDIDTIMREELGRMNPLLPLLIADQDPIATDEKAVAMRNVLSHFEGDPPQVSFGSPSKVGCLAIALALAVTAIALAAALWRLL